MIQAIHHRRAFVLVFICLVLCVYSTAWFVIGNLPTMEGARVVAAGLICDIVVVVPLAFYLLFVRRAGHSFIRVAPIEQFRIAAFGLLKNHRAAGVFATEISIFYYGLGSWRGKSHSQFGANGFTYHRRSGLAGLVFGFVLILAIEGFAVHLLLSLWSELVAWLFTFSSAYGALWLISDYRASVLRPILIGSEKALVRGGIRFTVEIPREKIVKVSHEKPDFGKEALGINLFGAPSHWIILSEKVEVQGAYGTTKRVRAIGVAPDDPQKLEQALVSSPT